MGYLVNYGLINELRIIHLLLFCEIDCKELIWFPICSVDFTSESVWSMMYSFLKVNNCQFNFFKIYVPVQIIFIFLSVGRLHLSKRLFHFILNVRIWSTVIHDVPLLPLNLPKMIFCLTLVTLAIYMIALFSYPGHGITFWCF